MRRQGKQNEDDEKMGLQKERDGDERLGKSK